MIADGRRAIIGVSRGDHGNLGLQTSADASLAARGRTVLQGIVYPTDAPDLDLIAFELDTRLENAIFQYGEDAVGVYLTAFDEGAELLAIATAYPALNAVRWYGSDGVVASPAFLETKTAPVAEEIEAQTGLPPDAFGLSTYDAVWLVTLAYLQAGGTRDLARYKDAFTRTAETYFGVTGWTRLNDAGDRATGAFAFHGICPADGGYEWRHVATYEPTADGIGLITFPGC